jgi:hypothetical protein
MPLRFMAKRCIEEFDLLDELETSWTYQKCADV